MCLFPILNNSYVPGSNAPRYFECGSCPECLRKRSNRLVLRAYYEMKRCKVGCMCTLTYDNYIYDDDHRIIGEVPPNPDLHVNVRDVQLFIKRVRKRYGNGIRYRLDAEYGSKTHRAHYHVLFFGFCFEDLVFYKKSKRGNYIYKSPILTQLWGHGICTVDCKTVNSAVTRYCSKYASKSRAEDTFSLQSHHLGLEGMLEDFNGIKYSIEQYDFPIPSQVWERVISERYCLERKYTQYVPRSYGDQAFFDSYYDRMYYRQVRDADPAYQRYLSYWKRVSKLYERVQLSVFDRIRALDDSKFHAYKARALEILNAHNRGIPLPAPSSRAGVGRYNMWLMENGYCTVELERSRTRTTPKMIIRDDVWQIYRELFGEFGVSPPRPITPNDTVLPTVQRCYMEMRRKNCENAVKRLTRTVKNDKIISSSLKRR